MAPESVGAGDGLAAAECTLSIASIAVVVVITAAAVVVVVVVVVGINPAAVSDVPAVAFVSPLHTRGSAAALGGSSHVD